MTDLRVGHFYYGRSGNVVVPKINGAHGSETRNIINRAIEVLNQHGIYIWDLVAEGQLTPTQFFELIREVNGLIAKGEVKLDDLSPEILEAINDGSGTPFEISSIPRDNSVSPKKTTFIDISSNLFNKKNITSGHTLNTDGEPTPHNDYSVSNFIDADELVDYTLKKSAIYTSRIAYYDDAHDLINSIPIAHDTESRTINTPEGTRYIRVSVRNEDLDIYQINIGDTALPYENGYNRIKRDVSLPLDNNDIELIYANDVLQKVVEENGNTTELEFDVNGNLLKTIEISNGEAVETTFTFDGNSLASVNRTGGV